MYLHVHLGHVFALPAPADITVVGVTIRNFPVNCGSLLGLLKVWPFVSVCFFLMLSVSFFPFLLDSLDFPTLLTSHYFPFMSIHAVLLWHRWCACDPVLHEVRTTPCPSVLLPAFPVLISAPLLAVPLPSPSRQLVQAQCQPLLAVLGSVRVHSRSSEFAWRGSSPKGALTCLWMRVRC